MTTAVVTIAHGRHGHLRLQHRSLSTGTMLPDSYVVVAMGDDVLAGWRPDRGVPARVVPMPADSASLPLAAARNAGARAALDEGADVLVFLDVDCAAGEDLVAAYTRAAGECPDVVWSGPVTYLPPPPPEGYDLCRLPDADRPHPARPAPAPGARTLGADPDLFWSLSFAVHQDGWLRSGGFCEEYRGYGGEDTDFARVAVQEGLGLGWLGDARAYHQHHPTQDPPVQHVDAILRNARVFRRRWGTWPMVGWLEEFRRLGLLVEEDGEWRSAR
ncbi:MAG: Sugar transferase [Nocardioides sp.]|nr:Sugar transferase [Nocardioides sp.]